MKRKSLVFYFITLTVFCQGLPVGAISVEQENAIVDHCESIKDSLKTVQKNDSRTRVYLGGYYEMILSKFIMPLNVKMVESSSPSAAALVENQNNFAVTKTTFANDFVSYQKELEDLIASNCKTEPVKFYDELVAVRQKRKVVSNDVVKIRNLINEHIKLVSGLIAEMQK